MPFRKKLHFLLVLLVGVSCGLLLWMSLRKANRLAFELIQEKVFSIAVTTALKIDGDKVAQLTSPDQDGSELYNEVRDQMRNVRDANASGALPIRFLYLIRPLEEGKWEYVVDAEEEGDDKSYLGDEVEFSTEAEKPPLNEARADEEFSQDSFGTWLTAFAPVRNAAGEPVAVLGADIEAHRVQSLLNQLLVGDLIAMGISLALATALAAWLARKISRPLTELRDFVRGIERGDLTSRIEVQSNDEFGELARAVNQMADGLEERESLKGALVHYVRSQAADTKLSSAGEDATQSVTVLVSDLRGFSQLSSKLGSERVFALLNEYFSTMIDIVLRHRGSLEKSSDESVIAVFGAAGPDPHQARHAVEAALAMQHALAKLIRDWKIETNKPIFLECGIHCDDVTVGLSNTGAELEFDSVQGLIRETTRIKDEGRRLRNRLTISESVSKRLNAAFPIEQIEEATGDPDLYRVNMPMPELR